MFPTKYDVRYWFNIYVCVHISTQIFISWFTWYLNYAKRMSYPSKSYFLNWEWVCIWFILLEQLTAGSISILPKKTCLYSGDKMLCQYPEWFFYYSFFFKLYQVFKKHIIRVALLIECDHNYITWELSDIWKFK